jgi:hypothetical protein
MFAKFFNAIWYGIKASTAIAIIAAAVTFFGAPTFFGIVLITASAVMTVYAWAGITFVVAFLLRLFIPNFLKKKET